MNPKIIKIIKTIFTISFVVFVSFLFVFVILNILGISQKWIDAYSTVLIIELKITLILTVIYLIMVKD